MPKETTKGEKIQQIAGALFMVLIGVLFTIFVVGGKCDPEGTWLGCSFKGSVIDIIGVIVFYISLVFPVYYGIKGTLYSPVGSDMWNKVWLAMLVAGPLLIFLF